MLYYWLLFFFIAFGAKVILATLTIYLLLPADRQCNLCEGETILLRGGHVGRFTAWLFMHRVQRRWCPVCGWEGLARRGDHESAVPLASTPDQITTTRHSHNR
jgi:hypothetical protein